jgi:hypothetical protein
MFDDGPECRDEWREFGATSLEDVLVEDKVRRALRVLNALVVKNDADPSDIAELRRFAPLLAGAPLQELAWGVLQQLSWDLVRSEPYRPIDILN